MQKLRKGEKLLPAVQPNAGIRALYFRKLTALIKAMSRSYEHWLRASYRANPPKMALDALPARELERRLRLLGIQWEQRFATAAPMLARYFAQSAARQSERVLKKILRDAGVTVRLTMTPQLRDIMQATVNDNVSLIRSIQSEYHTQVAGIVMRSVTEGRDLSLLSKELAKRYGITERRAADIALNQNNQATSAIQRERQVSLGLEDGIWMHSHAGKVPRPTHLANDQKRFSIREGWHDPDPKVNRRIWPGQLIKCRCTWRPIVRGFS